MSTHFFVAKAFSLANVPMNKKQFKHKTESGDPPSKYAPPLEMGSYCICAEANMYKKDEDKTKVGNIKGYDDSMEILEVVRETCERNVERRNWRCGETTVIILPNTEKSFVCDGIFFEIDGREGRIVSL